MKRIANSLLYLTAIAFIFSFSASVFAQAEKLNGRDIAVKVDDRPDGNDRQSTLEMTLINKRGKKRVRVITAYYKDYGKDSKAIMFFQSPSDVKGTGFLQFEYDDPGKDDDRWLYLPALKRVRRISGSTKNEYFMGSDFTYDDLGDRSVDEDEHTLLREEELDGQKCWVVESVSKDKNYMYSKVIRWIRQDALMDIKIEFYDRHGALMKVLTVGDIKLQDGFWTAFSMEMDNLQDEHKTLLKFTDVKYNSDLSDSIFRVSTLERGRIR